MGLISVTEHKLVTIWNSPLGRIWGHVFYFTNVP